MEQWTRCWGLTRRSFELIGAHRALLWFPVLSAFASLGCAALTALPAVYFYASESALSWPQFVVFQSFAALLGYFALAWVGALFDFATVHASASLLRTGRMAVSESVASAFSRAGSVLLWGLFAGTIGVLFQLLDRASRRKDGTRRKWLASLHAVAGVAWSAVTAFVVPAMVCEDVGPFEAMRRSADVLSRTWGTHLVRHAGIGLVAFVCALPVLPMLACAGLFATWQLYLPAALVSVSSVLFLLGLWVVFRLATKLFDTALYLFARAGIATGGYAPEQFANAFRVTKA